MAISHVRGAAARAVLAQRLDDAAAGRSRRRAQTGIDALAAYLEE